MFLFLEMEISWRAAAAGRGRGSQLGVGNGERYGGVLDGSGDRRRAGGARLWCL